MVLLLLEVAPANNASVGTGLAESLESTELLLLLGDGASLEGPDGEGLDGEERAGVLGGGLASSDGSVGLVGLVVLLVGVEREEDELGLVLGEAGDVLLHSLNRAVLTTVIYSNADGESLAAVDLGGLELLKGESTAEARAGVVADGLALYNRSQGTSNGARESLAGLLLAKSGSLACLGGLIEPGLHTALPLLLEMAVRHLIVVLWHCLFVKR